MNPNKNVVFRSLFPSKNVILFGNILNINKFIKSNLKDDEKEYI